MSLNVDQQLVNEVCKQLSESIPGLELGYIYGSVAKNNATKASDLDIAFLAHPSISSVERFNLAQSIAIELDVDVDLVDLAEAGDVLRKEVVVSGQLIFGDQLASDLFYLRVIRDYQDQILRMQRVGYSEDEIGQWMSFADKGRAGKDFLAEREDVISDAERFIK